MGKPVNIYSRPVVFPGVCCSCLGKSDLTTFEAKSEEKYLHRTHMVPICKHCKNQLMNKERKQTVKPFVVSVLVFWGLLFAVVYFYGFAIWSAFWSGSLVNVGFWFSLLLIILAILAGTPLVILWSIIKPTKANWPVKLAGTNTFHFVNEAYAHLFKSENKGF